MFVNQINKSKEKRKRDAKVVGARVTNRFFSL